MTYLTILSILFFHEVWPLWIISCASEYQEIHLYSDNTSPIMMREWHILPSPTNVCSPSSLLTLKKHRRKRCLVLTCQQCLPPPSLLTMPASSMLPSWPAAGETACLPPSLPNVSVIRSARFNHLGWHVECLCLLTCVCHPPDVFSSEWSHGMSPCTCFFWWSSSCLYRRVRSSLCATIGPQQQDRDYSINWSRITLNWKQNSRRARITQHNNYHLYSNFPRHPCGNNCSYCQSLLSLPVSGKAQFSKTDEFSKTNQMTLDMLPFPCFGTISQYNTSSINFFDLTVTYFSAANIIWANLVERRQVSLTCLLWNQVIKVGQDSVLG